MPAWLVENGDELRLYYIGWNVIGTRFPITSRLGWPSVVTAATPFSAIRQGPILDRSFREPYFTTTPCVLREQDRWRMWYVSCHGLARNRWPLGAGLSREIRRIGGWDFVGTHGHLVVHRRAAEGFAVGRPCVFGSRIVTACFIRIGRSPHYRTDPDAGVSTRLRGIGGRHRVARDDEGGEHRAFKRRVGFGNDRILLGPEHRGPETYLLYNGNGFGRSGFGIARLRHASSLVRQRGGDLLANDVEDVIGRRDVDVVSASAGHVGENRVNAIEFMAEAGAM